MTGTVRVELGTRGYDIVIGAGLIAEAGRRLAPLLARPKVFVVSDETVAGHYLTPLTAALEAQGIGHEAIVLPPGEATKSFARFESLTERLLDLKIERSDHLVALGGGVIGDVAGFAAAVVRRGLPIVQIPTTLLAQVDSAVGGKTGINATQGKNLVGAFHQPSLVLADIAVLDTLPRRELLAGYAECVKYGLIGDADFFAWLERHGAEVLAAAGPERARAIETACRAKARLVAADEHEAGARALLNLGHTFGHALEAELGYDGRLLHGEAVAVGMVLAFELSALLGVCSPADVLRVRGHLAAQGLATGLDQIGLAGRPSDRLIGHMEQDKKVRDGRPAFVLARGIGQAFLTREVSVADLRAVLERTYVA